MNDAKKKWIFTGILAAIEILMTVTNTGYYTIGKTAFTVLHIPVFIATIMIGLPYGVLIAAIFGGSSMISAYLFQAGVLDYLFQDPRISVIPRLMIPFAVWIVHKLVCWIADDHTLSAKFICTGFASMAGVVDNAVFVISAVAMIAPEAIGITDSISASTIVVTNIIATNIVFEITASVVIISLTVLIMHKLGLLEGASKDSGLAISADESDADQTSDAGQTSSADQTSGSGQTAKLNYDKPLKKTFRKWLFLMMSITFFFTLVFFYLLLTNQDQRNVEVLLTEKSDDITRLAQFAQNSLTKEDLIIGETGYVAIAHYDDILDCGLSSLEVAKLSDLCQGYEDLPHDQVISLVVNGMSGSGILKKAGNYAVLSFVPDSEVHAVRDRLLAMMLFGLILLFLLLFELISILIQRNVVQQIHEVNNYMGKIRAGNLDERIAVSGSTEFEELSLGINTTVNAMQHFMHEIAEKNRAEMEFGREVQNSSLPAGSLTGRGNFGCSVLGYMEAAREVGGDFYDYFLIGEDKLGFLVADVSGKGVPAALFMMRAKTLINNYVLEGKSPAEALQLANVQLCANNEKGMFVTVWVGILELQTGTLEFANAAHNPPLLKKAGQPFVFMDHKTYMRSLILAGLEESKFYNNVISLDRGDMLFLYTDGVTEAANQDLKLYGEERLLTCLEENYMLPADELIKAVRTDIDTFAAGMEQYDDITMLVMKMD